MGRGRTRRKTRGSPGGGGGQVPDAWVFWFHFCWDLIYVQKLGVSGQSPLQLGAGCGLRERPGACAQVVAAQVAHESLPVGARAGDRSAGLPSSVLVHQGPGEQPPGQRETHAWTLTPRAQKSLKKRQTLGNQEEEDISLSWGPWARGPSFQCRRVYVAHAWADSPKLFPPWKAPPLTGCSCADGSGSWVRFRVGAD